MSLTECLSLVIALIALSIALWQLHLNRIAIQAQTFMTIVNTAREIQFSKVMDKIRKFKYTDYKTYKLKESRETQRQVREVVDFLNDVMHMIKHGYLTRHHVLNIYFVSIRACEARLLSWWVEGIRQE
jgi:hypothetical protein